MEKKKRIVPRLLAVILCLSLLIPVSSSAADLYFTSVNDNVLPLTSDTMPVMSGGLVYVPYSVFDSNTTGIDLGFYCSYGKDTNTVTLFTTHQMLVFDLRAGTCRDDISGETYAARAIVRNGRPYLPLVMVCRFWGLEPSIKEISQGYLVRIKSDAAVLSDTKFIDAAGDLINRRLREYNQSLNPTVDKPPSIPVTPVVPEEENPSSTDVRTYLSFRCKSGEGVAEILDAMDSAGVRGLFLFTPQALESESGLVRRILGTGHSLGLLTDGENPDQTRALLDQGLGLLERTAHTRTTLVYAPKDQRAALESGGWVCWNESMVLSPSPTVGVNTFASRTIQRLKVRTQATYLTMDGDSNAARVLPSLLRQLKNNSFVVSIPMETRL